MKISRQYLLILLTALLLAGCAMQPPAPVQNIPPATQPPITEPLPGLPAPSTMEYPDAMLATPKVRGYHWNDAIQPMISALLQSASNSPPGLLLINTVSNSTNGTLPVADATSAVYNALAGNPLFTLVSQPQVQAAREQLGLSAKDRLITRGKALAIGRTAGAQYVLYTAATGNVATPVLQMQLLQVQSGEIIGSASGQVQQQ